MAHLYYEYMLCHIYTYCTYVWTYGRIWSTHLLLWMVECCELGSPMSSQVVVASCGKSILNAVEDRQKRCAQMDALLDGLQSRIQEIYSYWLHILPWQCKQFNVTPTLTSLSLTTSRARRFSYFQTTPYTYPKICLLNKVRVHTYIRTYLCHTTDKHRLLQ